MRSVNSLDKSDNNYNFLLECLIVDNLIEIHNVAPLAVNYLSDLADVEKILAKHKISTVVNFVKSLGAGGLSAFIISNGLDIDFDTGMISPVCFSSLLGAWLFQIDTEKEKKLGLENYIGKYQDNPDFMDSFLPNIQIFIDNIIEYAKNNEINDFDIKKEIRRIFTKTSPYVQAKKALGVIEDNFDYRFACYDLDQIADFDEINYTVNYILNNRNVRVR